MRGGEKVLEAIGELYPDATIHTLVHLRGSVSAPLERHPERRSFVQWLPSAAPPLPPLPAGLPDGHRTVRLRPVRSGHQHEPLRGEIGRGSGPRPAHLLLPLPDAVRVGSVRLVFRCRPGRAGRLAAAQAGPGPAGPLGRRARPGGWTAMWRILIMLRAESADTIITGRPSCIPLSIQLFTVLTPSGAPNRSSLSSQRWCPTRGWMSRSRLPSRRGHR